VTAHDDKAYFRPDIEGLRAVAIGIVLLYHAGIPGADGGFIGVDVFFVISGFLITGLLVREWTSSGRIDLLTFYARRFRRLLPAALLTLAVTVVASYLVLSSLRFPAVAGDAASAALYVSNLRFAANAIDYLGAETAPSPVLHFWSLSVEEQYYLFWPLVVVVSLRLLALRRFGLLVGVMVALSFGLALVWTDLAAPWAFFSLPTRAWELGVGALIAVGILRLPRRTPHVLTSASVWAGLGLIAAGVVVIGPGTPYPGTAALIPVVGTALVIVGGSAATPWPSRLLAMRVPRWVGRISYSLYLWHWPILVLVPLALGVESLALNVALVGVAVVIAAASTELIEVPIRSGRALPMPPRASLVVAGAASVAVAVCAITAGAIVLGPATTPVAADAVVGPDGELPAGRFAGPVPDSLTPSLEQAYDDVPSGYADGCHLDYATVEPPDCTYGSPEASTPVLLLGDSHAQQWLPALQRLADERGWRLRAITKSACPMVDATVWNGPLKRAYRECDAWRERALRLIEEEQPELVLIASADMYDVLDEQGRPLKDSAGGSSAEAAAWDAGLASYLARVAGLAPHVVVLADTPRVGYSPAECLATTSTIEACDARRERMVDEAYAARESRAAGEAGAAVVSATDWLCEEAGCPLVRGSTLVYRDSHHLTATFAAQLGSRVGAAIDAVTGNDLARD
jgi:peptidoglycan/LPS O-acetylase OafA/YrhL